MADFKMKNRFILQSLLPILNSRLPPFFSPNVRCVQELLEVEDYRVRGMICEENKFTLDEHVKSVVIGKESSWKFSSTKQQFIGRSYSSEIYISLMKYNWNLWFATRCGMAVMVKIIFTY